ncbi:MAG: HAD family hydrolase [Dysgonamonadaceae bacterium]|jgi:phosphoglycolate phosphatase|nr:HAD family hydrolase [Dysgonamonadaceae bacterium]
MNSIRAIIFDLDGTLVDSLADIADAMNRTLMRFNCPVHDYEAYKYFVGNGLKNLVHDCLPDDKKDENHVMECLKIMMEEYGKSYAEKTRLYNGIPELLDTLSGKGLKMAVLSNKADELTQKICSKLLKKWHFEIILGATEHFPRKPNPESALHILKKINVSPENVLYPGDTNVDMQTARAAGLFAIGVTWGFRTKDELLENGACAIIDNPLELLKFT